MFLLGLYLFYKTETIYIPWSFSCVQTVESHLCYVNKASPCFSTLCLLQIHLQPDYFSGTTNKHFCCNAVPTHTRGNKQAPRNTSRVLSTILLNHQIKIKTPTECLRLLCGESRSCMWLSGGLEASKEAKFQEYSNIFPKVPKQRGFFSLCVLLRLPVLTGILSCRENQQPECARFPLDFHWKQTKSLGSLCCDPVSYPQAKMAVCCLGSIKSVYHELCCSCLELPKVVFHFCQ